MSRSLRRMSAAGAIPLLVAIGGCLPPTALRHAAIEGVPSELPANDSSQAISLQRVTNQLPAKELSAATESTFPERHPDSVPEVLDLQWFLAEVEARNPTLEALNAAWQAAAQRPVQQQALDDPLLMGMLAPESAGSRRTETAYAWQLNQKLPWFGKRRLRGAAAEAEADAAFEDAQDARLAVRLIAELAFLDYYQSARLRELNRENRAILEQFHQTALAKFRTGQVTQQDVLQAELELAELARRQLELDRMVAVAAGRMNVLLRRPPEATLPPASAELPAVQLPSEAVPLWQQALQRRSDLAALAWRVEQAQLELELACRNFFPDVDLFGRYDTFWQPSATQGPLRGQIGLTVNLPVWRDKLRAAVCEAQFRVQQRRAEFDQRALDIQYEVEAAWHALVESHKTVDLYVRQLVPTAEQNVAAARANYEANRQSFLELALAQRQLVTLRQQELEAQVMLHRRAAELRRAIGGDF